MFAPRLMLWTYLGVTFKLWHLSPLTPKQVLCIKNVR